MNTRAFRTSILALFAAACTSQTPDIVSGGGAPEAPTIPALSDPAHLDPAGPELPTLIEVDRDEENVTLRLMNETGERFQYSGYSASSPLFGFEVEKGGDWVNEGFGWCGTGVEQQTLAPGEAVDFVVWKGAERSMRVVLSLLGADGEYVSILSPKIDVERPVR